MLRSLSVRNYVLIDSLEISFPEGLIIITGQTGAGKSVLLGALGLVLGAKADVSAIWGDAPSCVVEASFFTDDQAVREAIEQCDADWDGGNLLIRRVVNRSARSRAFVNDSPVPLPVLQQIASSLVDVHSQHQTRILSDRGFQLAMLDRYAGDGDLLEKCAESWKRLSALGSALEESRNALARLREESDYISARHEQLEKASLVDGELEALEAEEKRLANAEEIKESLQGVGALLSPRDDSAGQPVDVLLKEASRLLGKVIAYVPSLEGLPERLESARIEIADIIDSVEAADDAIDVSPGRLQEVEDRLSMLYDLMKRFSCNDIASLIAKRDSLGGMISDTEGLEEKCNGLEKEIKQEKQKYESICSSLHEARSGAAPSFAAAIEDSLHSLELEKASFDVQVNVVEGSSTGMDSVLFRFSAAGEEPVDVSKCASGGEMSRIMLSLKAMMARYSNMPTLVFDEIDTGVSGSAADKMGSMICSMGKDMQVFAITHLPQVAAKGSAHYLVEKSGTTTIRRIDGEDRVMEIARMLSGSSITPAAIANAKSLLG